MEQWRWDIPNTSNYDESQKAGEKLTVNYYYLLRILTI